ncbi:putative integral membrane protein [Aspergillus venezuelensis]
MASALLNSPQKLLLLTPVISSTGTIMYAGCEALFFSAFLHPPVRPHSRSILPLWFRRVFETNINVLIGLNMVTISCASAILTIPGVRSVLTENGSRGLYVTGLIGTCTHFVFAPTMLGVIERITKPSEERKEGENDSTDEMERWLGIHYVRLLVADVPAWVAYIGAVLTTFSIRGATSGSHLLP